MLFFGKAARIELQNLAVSAQSKQDPNIPTGKITKKARVQRPPF